MLRLDKVTLVLLFTIFTVTAPFLIASPKYCVVLNSQNHYVLSNRLQSNFLDKFFAHVFVFSLLFIVS